MTPVDDTSTEEAGTAPPKPSETAFASASQACMPSSPVQALAIPEFTTTACTAAPDAITFLSHCTGAAFTTFDVKVPAVTHGFSLKIIAISSRPCFRIPAAAAEAINPSAAQTPPFTAFIPMKNSSSPLFMRKISAGLRYNMPSPKSDRINHFSSVLFFTSRSFIARTFSGSPNNVMKPDASW